MRPDTEMSVVIRFIGDSKDPDIEFTGPALDVMKFVLTQTFKRTLKKRIEVYFAKTVAEAKIGFVTGTGATQSLLESMFDDSMFTSEDEDNGN